MDFKIQNHCSLVHKIASEINLYDRTQIVGWPPIHSHRKNTIASNTSKNKDAEDDADTKQGNECHYVKVSMDGAPYLRKVNLNTYSNYKELSLALEDMFTCFTIGELFVIDILFSECLYRFVGCIIICEIDYFRKKKKKIESWTH